MVQSMVTYEQKNPLKKGRFRTDFLWQVFKNHLQQRVGTQKIDLKFVVLLMKMAHTLVLIKDIKTAH